MRGRANRRGQRGGRAERPHDDLHLVGMERMLLERHIERRFGHGAGRTVSHIAHHAHNGHRLHRSLIEAADDLPPDGMLSPENLLHHAFARDDNARRVVPVERREIAAAQQRNTHSFEVAGAGQRPVRFRHLPAFAKNMLADHRITAVRPVSPGRQSHDGRGRLHAGQARQLRQQPVHKRLADSNVFAESFGGGIRVHDQCVVRAESHVHRIEREETAEKQASACGENKGKGNFGDDQRIAQRVRCAPQHAARRKSRA